MPDNKKSVDLWCPRCGKETHFSSDSEEFICECGANLGESYRVADLLDDAEKIRGRRKAAEHPPKKRGLFSA